MAANSGWRGLDGGERKRLIARVLGSAVFRWFCFAGMILISLYAEARPAPRVPDLLIDRVPYVEAVNHWNYYLWLLCYIPPGLVLLYLSPVRFSRFMVTGGLLSLVRGACIMMTGLGPVRGDDVNAARLAEPGMLWTAFKELIDPTGVFVRKSAHLYLTKDLFFSGHTATTLLVLLYVWPWKTLRRVMIALHLIVVASLFLGHIHYTIDVVGAWAITFTIFVIREGRPTAGLTHALRE